MGPSSKHVTYDIPIIDGLSHDGEPPDVAELTRLLEQILTDIESRLDQLLIRAIQEENHKMIEQVRKNISILSNIRKAYLTKLFSNNVIKSPALARRIFHEGIKYLELMGFLTEVKPNDNKRDIELSIFENVGPHRSMAVRHVRKEPSDLGGKLSSNGKIKKKRSKLGTVESRNNRSRRCAHNVKKFVATAGKQNLIPGSVEVFLRSLATKRNKIEPRKMSTAEREQILKPIRENIDVQHRKGIVETFLKTTAKLRHGVVPEATRLRSAKKHKLQIFPTEIGTLETFLETVSMARQNREPTRLTHRPKALLPSPQNRSNQSCMPVDERHNLSSGRQRKVREKRRIGSNPRCHRSIKLQTLQTIPQCESTLKQNVCTVQRKYFKQWKKLKMACKHKAALEKLQRTRDGIDCTKAWTTFRKKFQALDAKLKSDLCAGNLDKMKCRFVKAAQEIKKLKLMDNNSNGENAQCCSASQTTQMNNINASVCALKKKAHREKRAVVENVTAMGKFPPTQNLNCCMVFDMSQDYSNRERYHMLKRLVKRLAVESGAPFATGHPVFGICATKNGILIPPNWIHPSVEQIKNYTRYTKTQLGPHDYTIDYLVSAFPIEKMNERTPKNHPNAKPFCLLNKWPELVVTDKIAEVLRLKKREANITGSQLSLELDQIFKSTRRRTLLYHGLQEFYKLEREQLLQLLVKDSCQQSQQNRKSQFNCCCTNQKISGPLAANPAVLQNKHNHGHYEYNSTGRDSKQFMDKNNFDSIIECRETCTDRTYGDDEDK